ncbi:MAG: DUF1667 domain-containing protein [Desulfobacterales bacterium]|nr:DUF1667 domain-containing protein [Desulfobacterales bacterium]
MTEAKQYTCIGCPIGCPLHLEHDGNTIKEVSGYECDRGAKYAHQEFIDPRRSLSTTVAISGAMWPRLPIRTCKPIHKDQVLEAVRKIQALKLQAPVKMGQVLIRDFMGEKGIDVVACRTMKRADESS